LVCINPDQHGDLQEQFQVAGDESYRGEHFEKLVLIEASVENQATFAVSNRLVIVQS
jgi:hypothetical protein